MSTKKVSMADIARLSGVSVATVSRILNRNGRFSVDTERKVMDIIEKCGYSINLSAKTLRTSHSQSIGVIVPDITNEFFAKIIRSVETYLADINYTLFVCDSNECVDTELHHIRNLVSKDVDGIIYISGQNNVQSIHDQFDLPVVYIDRRPENADTLVISDNEEGGYLATSKLIRCGCKKIIMLRDFRNLSPIRHRLNGYKTALEKAGIAFDNNLVIDTKVDYLESRKTVSKLLNDGLKFDGIFACTDMIGIGAMHALVENGYKVPEDVKIIGFDDISASSICYPPLSTIHQNTDMIGKYAVEELMKLVNGEKGLQGRAITVDVNLIERSTT